MQTMDENARGFGLRQTLAIFVICGQRDTTHLFEQSRFAVRQKEHLELPKGAQGWTPFGQPYFGKGIQGTLKKYQWMFFGSPTGGQQLDVYNRQQEIQELQREA